MFPFGDALELTVLLTCVLCLDSCFGGAARPGGAGHGAQSTLGLFRCQLRVVPVATAVSPRSGMAPGSAGPRGLDASPEQTAPWSWGGPFPGPRGTLRFCQHPRDDQPLGLPRDAGVTFVLHMSSWECYLNLLNCRKNERWVEKSDKRHCPIILDRRRGADAVRNARGPRLPREPGRGPRARPAGWPAAGAGGRRALLCPSSPRACCFSLCV